jgi:hypothetical protein
MLEFFVSHVTQRMLWDDPTRRVEGERRCSARSARTGSASKHRWLSSISSWLVEAKGRSRSTSGCAEHVAGLAGSGRLGRAAAEHGRARSRAAAKEGAGSACACACVRCVVGGAEERCGCTPRGAVVDSAKQWLVRRLAGILLPKAERHPARVEVDASLVLSS